MAGRIDGAAMVGLPDMEQEVLDLEKAFCAALESTATGDSGEPQPEPEQNATADSELEQAKATIAQKDAMPLLQRFPQWHQRAMRANQQVIHRRRHGGDARQRR